MGFFSQGALIEQLTSTVKTGGTTNLTTNSTTWQRFTGSSTQTIVLPDATNLIMGRYFIIENESETNVTINFYGGSFAAYVAAGTQRFFRLYGNSTSVGDWVIGNQVDLEGPLALYASRPTSNNFLNIRSNQLPSIVGSTLSTAPADDILNVYPDTSINMVFYSQTGGVSGGTVLTEGGVFTRPSVTTGDYVRMVLTYISDSNSINTKFSASFSSKLALQSALTANPGILFASIDGMPIGYVDLKSLGTFNFCTADSITAIIENINIIKFAAGTGSGSGGDSSFKFQSIVSNILTIKKGYLLLNDGRELYSATDFTVDLTTISAIDGNYYGYIDLSSITTTPTYLNGRKLYTITASNFLFSTSTPDSYGFNLSRFIPIGIVQRTSGTWVNQKTTALRRHDNIVLGTDASLEYSQAYTTVGSVGSTNQIKAGHELDSYSFPSTISSSNISWYGLINANETSSNGRNLTAIGSPLFTDPNIFGVSNCFAPDGVNDYLRSASSFFGPSAATNFSFGLWVKADNYSAPGIQVLISNWDVAAAKSYKLQLNAGNLQFVTSSDGLAENTTFLYAASTLTGWNHIVVTYDASGTLFKFYLNGAFLLSASLAIYSGVTTFNLAGANGANLFAGSMDEFFFINGNTLSVEAIEKLYSTKFNHNRNLTTTSQRWSAIITDINNDIEHDLTNFVIDITPNTLYANFSGQTSTDKIAVKMHNIGVVGLSKPVKSRTLIRTAAEIDALLPITHYLYDVPTLKLQADIGSSQFATYDDSTFFKSTNTQILSTGTTLTSIIGASTQVRFTYSVGGESINSRLLGSFIIVGDAPDADFSDLWSALAATSTIAGSRILVISDQSTSIARTISNTDIYIEFLPGVKISSTVMAGTVLTFNGTGLSTNNMTLLLQGNADGILFSSTATYHDNLDVRISGSVNNVITFGTTSINNRIEGNIQLYGGSFNIAVLNSATLPNNEWYITSDTGVVTGGKTFSGANTFTDISIGTKIAKFTSDTAAASATDVGIVTVGAQTIAGAKTFSDTGTGTKIAKFTSDTAAASATDVGIVTVGAQTIAGAKTFQDGIYGLGALPIGAILPIFGTTILPGSYNCTATTVADSSGFVLCNGQVIADATSPLNGQTIPDINGNTGSPVFLRGNTVPSSIKSGSDSFTIASNNLPVHTHAIAVSTLTGTSHSHNVSGYSLGATVGHTHSFNTLGESATHSHFYSARPTFAYSSNVAGTFDGINHSAGNTVSPISSSNTTGHTHSGSTSDFSNNHSHSISFVSGSEASHTHSISSTTGNGGFANDSISNIPKYLSVKYIMRIK